MLELTHSAPPQVESELTQICNSILGLLDQNLIPSATTGESKVRVAAGSQVGIVSARRTPILSVLRKGVLLETLPRHRFSTLR